MILQLPEKCPTNFGAYTNFFLGVTVHPADLRKPKFEFFGHGSQPVRIERNGTVLHDFVLFLAFKHFVRERVHTERRPSGETRWKRRATSDLGDFRTVPYPENASDHRDAPECVADETSHAMVLFFFFFFGGAYLIVLRTILVTTVLRP
jgi:hypothetical protein